MSSAVRTSSLEPLLRSWGLFFCVLLCSLAVVSAKPLEYLSQDGKVALTTSEAFREVPNPHTVMSLQTEDQIVVLVTAQKKRFSLTEIYDGLPSTFEDGAECVGRVLLSIDGEDAATFLVEGMFPPDAPATHHTLYVVSQREDLEYTFMIHYPKEQGDAGFEWATGLLREFSWR